MNKAKAKKIILKRLKEVLPCNHDAWKIKNTLVSLEFEDCTVKMLNGNVTSLKKRDKCTTVKN